jgi:cytochrome c551/c552
VAASYQKDIEPTFKRACFDCHTQQTVWPWYHAIPGVKQYLDGHVEDGRRDFDIEAGVPFKGDAPLDRQLRRISRQVGNKGMPLWDYALMHPDARLSDADRQAIVAWADASYDDLSSTAAPAPADAPPEAPMKPRR